MKRPLLTILGILVASGLLTGCGNPQENEENAVISGARSALFTLEGLSQSFAGSVHRSSALLGIFVSEYLSRGSSIIVNSALLGIEAQTAMASEEEAHDEDYELLQAFADALQVDVKDLLNRSPNREESLNKYIEALRNVGTRSNERFDELETALDNIRAESREQSKVVSALEREQRDALREKDFSHAGEVQEQLNEEQAKLSDMELNEDKTKNIHDTFEDLLDVYGDRLLALESNRQALIVGITVVNVPGVEDFDLLQNPSRRERNDSLDLLINGEDLQDGLRLGN